MNPVRTCSVTRVSDCAKYLKELFKTLVEQTETTSGIIAAKKSLLDKKKEALMFCHLMHFVVKKNT